MARNVFISFRFRDGHKYKEELSRKLDRADDTIDFSEDIDRNDLSEETIKKYLYGKLARSSVIVVLLTPGSINHQKNNCGNYDDWIYDEIRYSLEDRENNKTKGIIAVYVPEAKDYIMKSSSHTCAICNANKSSNTILDFNNLARINMMNVKDDYKKNKCINLYDRDYDSYCSLVPYSEFINNIDKYIEIAIWKRENINHYSIHKEL